MNCCLDLGGTRREGSASPRQSDSVTETGSNYGSSSAPNSTIVQVGFFSYIILTFVTAGFCMTMLLIEHISPSDSPRADTFYASMLSFILGKWTGLVLTKLLVNANREIKEKRRRRAASVAVAAHLLPPQPMSALPLGQA
jgi:hypothetical protein